MRMRCQEENGVGLFISYFPLDPSDTIGYAYCSNVNRLFIGEDLKMKDAIEYYTEMYLSGVDSTTISQTVQALFDLDNETLSIVADAGIRSAKTYYANLRELKYA